MNRKRAFVSALLLTLAAFGAGGCAADDCSRAGDRQVQCIAVEHPSDTISNVNTCEGLNLCLAQCINEASCDELVDAYNTTTGPTDKSRKFIQCVTDCQKKNGA